MSQTAAFALTLAIEVPIVLALALWRGWAPGAGWRLFLVAIGANALTHPLLWLSLAEGAPGSSIPFGARVALLELGATLIEGVLYAFPAGLGMRRGCLSSLVANATSTGIGFAIYAFF